MKLEQYDTDVAGPKILPFDGSLDLPMSAPTGGVFYMKLGNLLRDIAIRGGWQPDPEG